MYLEQEGFPYINRNNAEVVASLQNVQDVLDGRGFGVSEELQRVCDLRANRSSGSGGEIARVPDVILVPELASLAYRTHIRDVTGKNMDWVATGRVSAADRLAIGMREIGLPPRNIHLRPYIQTPNIGQVALDSGAHLMWSNPERVAEEQMVLRANDKGLQHKYLDQRRNGTVPKYELVHNNHITHALDRVGDHGIYVDGMVARLRNSGGALGNFFVYENGAGFHVISPLGEQVVGSLHELHDHFRKFRDLATSDHDAEWVLTPLIQEMHDGVSVQWNITDRGISLIGVSNSTFDEIKEHNGASMGYDEIYDDETKEMIVRSAYDNAVGLYKMGYRGPANSDMMLMPDNDENRQKLEHPDNASVINIPVNGVIQPMIIVFAENNVRSTSVHENMAPAIRAATDGSMGFYDSWQREVTVNYVEPVRIAKGMNDKMVLARLASRGLLAERGAPRGVVMTQPVAPVNNSFDGVSMAFYVRGYGPEVTEEVIDLRRQALDVLQ